MKLLIIGQTPPPYYGQSINIGEMLAVLEKQGFNYRFIRMHFSNATNEVGAVSVKKIWKLLVLLLKIGKELVIYKPDYVYYPPAGPDKTPVIRDMLLLFPIRLFHFKRIFHYHAGGVSTAEAGLNGFMRWWFRYVYYNADHSICLSRAGTIDPEKLQSKTITIIPTGVADNGFIAERVAIDKNFTVLFAGICRESKGIADFINVIRQCRMHNKNITGIIIGYIFSEKENLLIKQAVQEGVISYEGMLTGDEKIAIFRQSQALLFPSYFESENFPTVILEAFSFGMPVVSTNWRGIPDLVQNGHNGFLHEIHDKAGMTQSILSLASNNTLYQGMCLNARHDFETKYTMPIFEESVTQYFRLLLP